MSIVTTKLTGIGNSTGVVIPRDTLAELSLKKGDQVTIERTPDGLLITPFDPEHDAQVQAARKLLAKYRNTMKELAK